MHDFSPPLPPLTLPAGSGTTVVFDADCFKRRLVVLKKYVNENPDFQVEVLYALQISIAKLDHLPSKICDVWTPHTYTRNLKKLMRLTACRSLTD